MTTSNEKLASAINLIKQGNKQEGAKILANLLTLEPGLELAWLWLADCSESRERKISCLQMAIKINPNRAATQKALIDMMCVPQPAPSRQKIEAVPPAPIPITQISTPSVSKKSETFPKSQRLSIRTLKPPKSRLPAKGKFLAPDLAQQNIQKVINEKKISGEMNDKNGKISTPGPTTQKTPEVNREIEEENQKKKKVKKSRPKKVKEESKREIPFIPPKRIVVKTGENIYADVYWQYHKYPAFEGGMYGNTMFIDDVCINAFNMPRCLKIGKILDIDRCDLCTFFAPQECLIRNDPGLLNELLIFITAKRRRIIDYKKRRNAKIRALYIELKAHGRPLHYSVLAQIVQKRHPKLGFTEGAVLRTMTRHPDYFENVDKGVYQYKKSKR